MCGKVIQTGIWVVPALKPSLRALLLAKIANERLKILTSLLFDLQTSVRGQNGVEFCQESNRHVGFFLSLLLAKIANDSEWLRMTPGWVRVRARGEGRGGLFLGRFYFSKWLTLPVLGHKKSPSVLTLINKEPVCLSVSL